MAFSPGEMIALAVIFSILPIIVVGLRLWARRIMKARYGLDDYFIFAALVITITSGFAIVYGTAAQIISNSSQRAFDLSSGGVCSCER